MRAVTHLGAVVVFEQLLVVIRFCTRLVTLLANHVDCISLECAVLHE